ncbi:MAG: 1-(5-phosphoribosyl)-5-[(5-phosphoribosylamino)methylideneamino]imidazole-4-carboxamide isomerase [Proteocatella sp.]
MIIFPAIDIKDNKCVRLTQGKFDQINIYNDNPVEVAKLWESQGAEYIHLVDLDGAKNEAKINQATIESVINAVSIPVQIGGGIRSLQRAAQLIEIGAQRIILGTIAVTEKELTKTLAEKYPGKVAVSVDAVNGKAAVKGWAQISTVDVLDICSFMEEIGIRTLIYTDILMDGMLKGPNFAEYERLSKKTSLDIIASGGVTTLEDIKRLSQMDMYGAIVGKSLYDKRINLKEALECLRNE